MLVDIKIILGLIMASLIGSWIATNVFATDRGHFYFGGQLGLGDTGQSSLPNTADTLYSTASASERDGGLAGRLFAGYQFNPYFATELGYTKFSKTDAKEAFTIMTGTESYSAKSTTETYNIDMVGKIILPLQNGYSLYSKLGAAFVSANSNTTATTLFSGLSNTNITTVSDGSNTQHAVYPELAAGISYQLTNKLSADLSWTHIQKVGNKSIPNSDFIGFGLSYYFD